MRFLRRQSTNARGLYGQDDIRRDINGQIVLDSKDMMMVPKGTNADKITTPANGHMRYNTDTNVFENYQGGALRCYSADQLYYLDKDTKIPLIQLM